MRDYRNYIMRFNLTSFLGARVVEVENDDEVYERGVFIPIDRNALYEDPKSGHIMCEAFVNERTYAHSGDSRTHLIKQKLKKEQVEKINSLGFKTPILGALWKNEIYKKPSCQTGGMDEKRVKIK